MRVIKRYSNRKLYDTVARRYITHDEIAALVRNGVDVKVVDNVTGEDLTTLTLSQILTEKEKAHNNSLPKSFFTTVLQSGARIKEAFVEKGGKLLSDRLESALHTLRIPTRTEFETLVRTVGELEKTVRRLEKRLARGR